MARPTAARVTPAKPGLVVDGRTHFVARARVLDERGDPMDGRMVELAITQHPGGPPIHGTLAGMAQGVGDGWYTRAFLARDLERHLTPHAGRVVYLSPVYPGLTLAAHPYVVVLGHSGV